MRTYLAPYRTLARISNYSGLPAGGLVERERRGQLVVGVDLRLEIGDLLLGKGNGIGAGDEAARRRLLASDPDERSRQLGRIAGLPPVLRLPPLELLRPAVCVVLNGPVGKGHRLLREELGAEEPRVDDGGVDAERLDLGSQRLHPALETELRRGIGGTELEADEARPRRDRDDVTRALRAHDGQDRAGDIHRAEEARRQLPFDLLWRQLLEVARLKGPGVVDQHVDAAEPVDRGAHRRLGIGAAGNVQLDDPQVVQITHGLSHDVWVPTSSHHRVAGCQGGFDEIDAHATAGPSNEPDLPVSHGIIDTQPNLHHLTKAQSTPAYICTNVGPTSQVILANSQGFRTGKMDSLKISSESGMHQLSRKKDLPRPTNSGRCFRLLTSG